MGILFIAAPNGVLNVISDLGDDIGSFTRAPETVEKFWLAGGSGTTEGRTHDASATPAMAPNTANAIVPATDFSGFHPRCPEDADDRAET